MKTNIIIYKICIYLLVFQILISCEKKTDPEIQVILCIGQSNMAGRAEIPSGEKLPFDNIFLFNDKYKWEPATNPLNRYSTIRKDLRHQRLGPSWSFSKLLSSSFPDKKFGLVVNARGGTSIDEWVKGTTNYNQTIIRALEAQKSGKIIGIIWHQGESDRNNPVGYVDKFASMVKDLREEIGIPNLPIIVGEVGELRVKCKLVNEQIRLIPEIVSNSALVSVQGLSLLKDSAHFDTKSQLLLGKRYANEFIKLSTLQ